MQTTPFLPAEILRWFMSVGVVVPTIALMLWLPFLDLLSQGRSAELQFYEIAVGHGERFLIVAVALLLCLIWHAPRMLAANIERAPRWWAKGWSHSIFMAVTLVSFIPAAWAIRKADQCRFHSWSAENGEPHSYFEFWPAMCTHDPTLVGVWYCMMVLIGSAAITQIIVLSAAARNQVRATNDPLASRLLQAARRSE